VIIPLLVFAASSATIGALVIGDLLGEAGQAGLVYCEASRDGWIKQPANTWSYLGYVLAGLLVGFFAGRDSAGGTASAKPNRMRATFLYPALYASIAVFIGPASMALHATTTVNGGKIDVFSMYLWATFVLAYALTRVRDLSERRFLILFGGVSAFLVVQLLFDIPAISGTAIFATILAAYAVLESWIVARAPKGRYDRIPLYVAIGAFALAFSIWILSHTGAPLCDPHSLFQGHAVWHLLTAVSVGAFYFFYRSEDTARQRV
jgi:hypothetical protein